jgi:hypothetical protein
VAVRVFAEFSWNEKSWVTTSVSKNIIEASLAAIIDGYHYLLSVLEPESITLKLWTRRSGTAPRLEEYL